MTPNRGDALSVRGVARDLAAAGLGVLKPWRADPPAGAFASPIVWSERGAWRLPLDRWADDQGGAQRPLPGLAAAAAAVGGAEADQRAGRCDEFLHRRSRAAAACVRCGPGSGGELMLRRGEPGESFRSAERARSCRSRRGSGDRRRRGRGVAGWRCGRGGTGSNEDTMNVFSSARCSILCGWR